MFLNYYNQIKSSVWPHIHKEKNTHTTFSLFLIWKNCLRCCQSVLRREFCSQATRLTGGLKQMPFMSTENQTLKILRARQHKCAKLWHQRFRRLHNLIDAIYVKEHKRQEKTSLIFKKKLDQLKLVLTKTHTPRRALKPGQGYPIMTHMNR